MNVSRLEQRSNRSTSPHQVRTGAGCRSTCQVIHLTPGPRPRGLRSLPSQSIHPLNTHRDQRRGQSRSRADRISVTSSTINEPGTNTRPHRHFPNYALRQKSGNNASSVRRQTGIGGGCSLDTRRDRWRQHLRRWQDRHVFSRQSRRQYASAASDDRRGCSPLSGASPAADDIEAGSR